MGQKPYNSYDISLEKRLADAPSIGEVKQNHALADVYQKVEGLQNQVKLLQTEATTRMSKKAVLASRNARIAYIKEILAKHNFPQMQADLLRKLAKYGSREGKKLAKELGTNYLRSLKDNTVAAVERKKLSPKIKIKVQGRKPAIYSLQLPLLVKA